MSDIADQSVPSSRPILKFAYLAHSLYLLVPRQDGNGFDPEPLTRPVAKLFASIRRKVSEEDGLLCVPLAQDIPITARHTEAQRAQMTATIVIPLANHLGLDHQEVSWGDLLELHKQTDNSPSI